jgi:hypothetical protein
MDSVIAPVRNFAGANRPMIINVVYVVAFLVALYYLYKFLIEGSDLEVTLLNYETDGNAANVFKLPGKDVRVKQGGEYTISFWMYITSWEYRSGLAKSVLQILDANMPNKILLNTVLYPNEAKMMVRVNTIGGAQEGIDYTRLDNYEKLMSGNGGMEMAAPSGVMPKCDIQDIDLQRWINVTISVNGRIVDIYYDGKLARSCVLPDLPQASDSGAQLVQIGNKGGFGGKISGIQFFAYPLTPDRIYSIYQAGPMGQRGFVGYLLEKLGINLTYQGMGGAQRKVNI